MFPLRTDYKQEERLPNICSSKKGIWEDTKLFAIISKRYIAVENFVSLSIVTNRSMRLRIVFLAREHNCNNIFTE